MAGLLLIFIALVIYLTPMILALSRHHHQSVAIGALNILLGWTVLGWVGAMVWALTRVDETPPPAPLPLPTRACPFCAEQIQQAALVCRHCGRDVAPRSPISIPKGPPV